MTNRHCKKCLYRAAPGAQFGCNHDGITGETRLFRAVKEGLAETIDGRCSYPVEQCVFWKDKKPYSPDGKKGERQPKTAEQLLLTATGVERRKLELYLRGLNDTEIGEAVGVQRNAIMNWRKKHGLKSIVGRGRKT